MRKKNKIYLLISQIFITNLKQLIKNKNYTINCYGLVGSNMTAAFVLRRIQQRLEVSQKGGFWILRTITNILMSNKHILGFKLQVVGRLTGNTRAQTKVIKKGIIANSSMNVYIDYAQNSYLKKHGKCGIKIWLVRNLIEYMPYKYVYSYSYKG